MPDFLPIACNMGGGGTGAMGGWILIIFLLALAWPLIVGVGVLLIAFFGVSTASVVSNTDSGFPALLRKLSRGIMWGKPLTLFVFAVLVPLAALALSALAVSMMWKGGDFWDTLLLWVSLMICAATVMFLIWGLRNEPIQIRKPAAAPLAPKTSNFQIWLQDLVIAALCFATGLLILSQITSIHHNDSRSFLKWAIYVFGVGAAGLLLSVDVVSRSTLGSYAVVRGVFFTGIFTLMPVAWPFATAGWWMWRKALKAEAESQP